MKRKAGIMNLKHFRSIVVSVCLGWLSPSLALAQPVITAQPTNHFVNASGAATFTVFATGVAPIIYQWLFDGTAIAGATNYYITVLMKAPVPSLMKPADDCGGVLFQQAPHRGRRTEARLLWRTNSK